MQQACHVQPLRHPRAARIDKRPNPVNLAGMPLRDRSEHVVDIVAIRALEQGRHGPNIRLHRQCQYEFANNESDSRRIL
ncbi:hypothetical protein SAMN04487768_2602 [Burkholderia sp. b13]|nr:hypothetical protein SAMN04487768_2602 [Burkholderia sp. b13]